jgi:SAM-dependent methyltransferase
VAGADANGQAHPRLKQRNTKAIQSEYHGTWSAGHGKYMGAAGPQNPSAWRWRGRKLALDGMVAARLRAPLLAAVIDRLEPKKVLEVGCGNGINLFSLAGDFPDVEFTGIDLTPAGIEAAEAVQAEDKLPAALAEYIPLPNPDPTAFKRIHFIQGSAAELPSPTASSTRLYGARGRVMRIRDQARGDRARQPRPCADAGAVQGHHRRRAVFMVSRTISRARSRP